ncbi:MAG: ABC transporter permease subunit, partial [Phycisphaerales bacterium]
NRTLGLLMTTPVNSFQIVIGKLSSKLLQLLLLLAISLPLLAIIRVFGGVPWSYVVSSLCITLTTVIFVGTLSLFFSIFTRRAYAVIIMTGIAMAALFALLPFLGGALWKLLTENWPEREFVELWIHTNPYVMMFSNTMGMLSGWGPGMGGLTLIWPFHCLFILASSALLLFVSMIVVRRVALRQATGQVTTSRRPRQTPKQSLQSPLAQLPRYKRVRGQPVAWKEFRSPILGRRKTLGLAAIFVGLLLLALTYIFFLSERALDEPEVHVMYAISFVALGMLFTVVIPATTVTSEKESRSWHLLLATTLTDWQILWGKFAGILRRCLPVWLLLLGHFAFCSFVGLVHPVAVLQMTILMAWLVVFLSGTGLYFSARFRHTTTAVILNFVLVIALWVLSPLLLALVEEVFESHGKLAQLCVDANPFVHAGVTADATAAWGRGLRNYDWAALRDMGPAESTIWMLFCAAGYMLLGLLFAWRAKCRFRRRIF